MKKYLILINPASHGGDSRKRWVKYAQKLPPDHDAVILSNIAEAEERARTASGYSCIIAAGGDGTINAAAHGVMQNPDPELKFGVLYTGTSPDFCRFHHIPADETAVNVLLAEHTKQIPVLTAGGHCFFCSCNLGMGASVASLANSWRPYLGDKSGTFCAVLWNILRSKKQDFILNGEVLKDCNHLLITRMPYIAGGLKLALPELKDDEYAVWYLQNMNFFRWWKVLFSLYRGKDCGTWRIMKEKLVIEGSGAVEYDGDPHGILPLEITFAGHKLNLITAEG